MQHHMMEELMKPVMGKILHRIDRKETQMSKHTLRGRTRHVQVTDHRRDDQGGRSAASHNGGEGTREKTEEEHFCGPVLAELQFIVHTNWSIACLHTN